jgi:arginyl-tRNA synthetase
VHMCQALLTYVREGGARTPEEAGLRGDHFVGDLYTRYHAGDAGSEGDDDDDDTARSLLLRLEAGDELVETHQRLVDWAIDGIRSTYHRVGVGFDASFRETDHLATARRVIARGLALGQLHRREDGCVVFRHDAERETVLVRADDTLLVYAQILGIDVDRFAGRSERVLSIFGHQWEAAALAYRDAAEGLAEPWAERYQPVFYGMVQLPDGSMRSRQGRAVSADDAIDRFRDALPSDFGGSLGLDRDVLAVAVLKYYLLRRARTKNLVFDLPTALERTVPLFGRVLAYAHPDLSGAEDGSSRVPELSGGKRETTALRRLLLGLNGFGTALDAAVTRLDPAVVLHYLEELVSLADQLPASVWTNRLRRAVAIVVRQCLASVDIGGIE